MSLSQKLILCFSFLLLSPHLSSATPSLGLTEDFEGAGDTGGFTSQDAVVSLSNPNSGGNPGGYLRIEFPSQGLPTPQEDTVSNNGLEYTGDYTQEDLRLEFDFLELLKKFSACVPSPLGQ